MERYIIKNKVIIVFFILLGLFLLPLYFHFLYYLYLVDIINETEKGRCYGTYKTLVFQYLTESTYSHYIETGKIKPYKYYYGPIYKEILTLSHLSSYQNEVPSWKRSDVPVDPFTNGVLFGKWYYGPGKKLYTGDPVYYFTDGKTYFGLVWADKDGNRHFKPNPNDTVEDLRKQKKKNVDIYYAEEINGKRRMYRTILPNGDKLYIKEDIDGSLMIW